MEEHKAGAPVAPEEETIKEKVTTEYRINTTQKPEVKKEEKAKEQEKKAGVVYSRTFESENNSNSGKGERNSVNGKIIGIFP